ncbi:Transposase DDE domain-containing protein, partial [Anaerovirgula multivorans]
NYYEETAKKYIELLNENDKTDKETVKYTKEEITSKLEAAKKRIEELTEMAEEIQRNGEISITDPDAKHMSVSNNGTDIAHNVQIAVDSKSHLVVAVDVVSTPADQNQLHNMASKAVEELGLKENNDLEDETSHAEKEIITVLADKGYYSGEELEKCKNDHIKTIVPKQKSGTKTGDEEYIKDKFIYDKDKDIYICPGGKELQNISKTSSKDKVYRNTKACSKCKHKDKCTTSKKGRVIKRGPYQETYDEVDKITLENKELYRQRQMIVEHPFGTIKRALGFTYFLTRGNENVKSESCMHFFTYNLIRVINILGAKELTRILKAKQQAFFNVFLLLPKIKYNSHKLLLIMNKKAWKAD